MSFLPSTSADTPSFLFLILYLSVKYGIEKIKVKKLSLSFGEKTVCEFVCVTSDIKVIDT
jgi:hypothetical protein